MENKYQEVMECIRDMDKSIRVSEKYLQEEPELLYILDIVKHENRPHRMMSEAVIQLKRKRLWTGNSMWQYFSETS